MGTLNNHFYFINSSIIHLETEVKGVGDTSEGLSFKKEKSDLNVEEPNASLGTVLNAGWNTESSFTTNLSCRNGDNDIEVSHWDSSGARGWPKEKRLGERASEIQTRGNDLGGPSLVMRERGIRHWGLGVKELILVVEGTKLCLLIWGDQGARNIEGAWGQNPEPKPTCEGASA